jgi:hypothetical protein
MDATLLTAATTPLLLLLQGACCASVLDAYGLCCPSGAVDECGVCDGAGASCSLHLRLLLQLPQGSTISGAGMPLYGGLTGSSVASPQLAAWVQTAILAAVPRSTIGGSGQLRLQPTQVSAKWTTAAPPAASQSSQPVPPVTTRHLLTGAGGGGGASAASLCDAASRTEREALASAADDSSVSAGVVCPSPSPTRNGGNSDSAAPTSPDTGRHLQQASIADTGSAVQLDAVLTPGDVLQLTHGALSTASFGLLGVGQLLASGLEQQVASSSSSSNNGPAAAGDPQLLRVMLVQRVGVCGNGVCEVGERQLLNSEGDVLQEAAAACVQDCPGSFVLCPAPVGPVGDADRECGGNGRCIRTSGTCDCNAG